MLHRGARHAGACPRSPAWCWRWLFLRSLDASVVIPATLDELAGEADLIVHARVARVDTRQAPGTLRVERVVTLAVVRALKGSPGEALAARAAGRHLWTLPDGGAGRARRLPRARRQCSSCARHRPAQPAWWASRRASCGSGLIPMDGAADGRRPRHVGDCRTGRARGHRFRGPQPLATIEARIARVVLAQLRGRRLGGPSSSPQRSSPCTAPGAAYMRFGLTINGTNTVLRWPGATPFRVSDAELADGISAGALDQALQRASAPGKVSPRQTSGSRARASPRPGRATTTRATSSASSAAPIPSGPSPSRATPST